MIGDMENQFTPMFFARDPTHVRVCVYTLDQITDSIVDPHGQLQRAA